VTGEHLLLLIALTSAMSAVTSWRRKVVSWTLVNGAFLVATALGYWFAPERAGLWLSGPYLVLVVVPIVALVWFHRMLAARRYRSAHALARIAFVLHPSRGHRNLVRLNRVFRLAANGEVDAAAELLRATGHEQEMKLEMLRLHNQWADILAHIDAETDKPLDHGAAVLYIRALGETGQLDRLVDLYFDAVERWSKRDDMTEELASLRLFVAAFLGQPAIVEDICAGPLRHYDESIKQYWRAIAHAAGGDRERAVAIWTELAKDDEWRMRSAAEYRLANPPVRAEPLPPALGELVAALATDVRDAVTYAGTHAQAARAIVSYAIAGALIAIHTYVWWRVKDDPAAIYDLGLFWSTAVLEEGEQWRIVTAVFLHAGWMHLAMNVLGLLWFGPFVERFLGRGRFAILYLAGGMAGFALLALLDALGWREATFALGASGSVMAVIGASTAIFLRGSARSSVAASRLRDMLGFVGLQVVFDILAPRVSMTAHLTGLAVGFLIGLALAPRVR
jgi:rhomboid protease GluP